ncbi:E3 ubiquitin-protein ligase highwire [Bienertia sinuspersici]
MAGNKFVAMFLMCMVVAAAMNMVIEAGDPTKGGSDVYNKCFEKCRKSCQGGETHCEMSCDETCDAEELKGT